MHFLNRRVLVKNMHFAGTLTPVTVILLVCWIATSVLGQDFTEPVVARIQMRLQEGEDFLDVIEKGDLLTVLSKRDGAYLIVTSNGHRGLVDQENAMQLVEAVELYDELIKENPKDGRYFTLRASAWWARGDQKKALADFDQAIATGFKSPDAFSSRGAFHAAFGDYDKAIADYTTAIKLRDAETKENTTDDSLFINRAAAYMAKQDFKKAIRDYDEAIRRQENKASSYQQRAVARKANGQLEDALIDFNKAIRLEPGNIDATMGRGYIWSQVGDHAKAIEDFSRVIEIDAESAEAFNNRGYSHQLLGKLSEALADYQKAIELSPTFSLALQNQAMLLAAAEDKKFRNGKKAIDVATKACELSNYQNLYDLKVLAAAFAEDGQFEKALGWQERAIEMANDQQRAGEVDILEAYKEKKPFRLGRVE